MKALKHEKNYQIWHHRQLVLDKLGDYTGEQNFISEMFERDSKNYHVWSYRWVLGQDRIELDLLFADDSIGL